MPLSEDDRAELVAYLDGELDEEARQAIEVRIANDPEVRALADQMRQAWGLLDFLPVTKPSPDFTQRTLSRIVGKDTAGPVAPSQRTTGSASVGSGSNATLKPQLAGRLSGESGARPTVSPSLSGSTIPSAVGTGYTPWRAIAGWSAAVVVAAGISAFIAQSLFRIPVQIPEPDVEFLHSLPVVEHWRLFEPIDDLEYLKSLAQPDLFGDESGD